MTASASPTPIQIYTDGSCNPNPGPGGWAAILSYGPRRKEIYGAQLATTNNRMELTAAISALVTLAGNHPCVLTTDSRYLQRGIAEWLPGWKRRQWIKPDGAPVLNADLWKALDVLAAQRSVSWRWVKGHAGHGENERADYLAGFARDMLVECARRAASESDEPAYALSRLLTGLALSRQSLAFDGEVVMDQAGGRWLFRAGHSEQGVFIPKRAEAVLGDLFSGRPEIKTLLAQAGVARARPEHFLTADGADAAAFWKQLSERPAA